MLFSHYFQTLRCLKIKQIQYQIWYRLRKRKPFAYSLSRQKEAVPLKLKPIIPKYICLEGKNVFTFLNQTASFTHWDDDTFGKLWSYNLNYMDYLLQSEVPIAKGREWVNQFISDIRNNTNGLDPYPIALRGINWIKFMSIHQASISGTERKEWDASLYTQYLILLDNIEYHLLGNHLLEDAFSLLWGGLYFQNEKIYYKAENVLRKELKEQILQDGAHFELSPMYHCLLLDRLLDCINATKNNLRFAKQSDLVSLMEEKAMKMLGWLDAIIYTDGTIPLLNDAANGIAPVPAEIFAYAERLGLTWKKAVLKDSGYRKFESPQLEMILDIGKIGPGYIPGHAHADTFTYELRINKAPFVIDTGISTYNLSDRRTYERGTSAHNTVTIDNENSSEIWSAFRVGKKAKIMSLIEHENYICGQHDGFKNKGIIHERSYSFSPSHITIKDRLISKGKKKGVNRIILHPEVKIESIFDNKIQTNKALIQFSKNAIVSTEIGKVSFEYNILRENTIIFVQFNNEMEYTISI